MLLTYKENVHSTQMYIPLKPLFSRHKGIGVQFTDEPTGNLDPKTTEDVINLLLKIKKKYNKTVIIVTHDMEIGTYCDRMIKIDQGTVVI